MISIDNPTLEHIKDWVQSQRGIAQLWTEWDDKIWSKSYDEIVNYIYNRFTSTLDTVEYYRCMPLLTDDLDPVVLYIPFKLPPQYLRLMNGQSIKKTTIKSQLLQKKRWTVPSKFKKFGR